MDKNKLQELAAKGFSTRAIADYFGLSQTTAMYWIRKHSIKVKLARTPGYLCRQCGETDPAKFYSYRKKMCARCDNERVKEKAYATRERVIQHLGGACSKCGYDQFHCALDVHHLAPSTKDPTFENMRYWSWKRVVTELETCILVCKNCHAAIHNGDL